MSRSPDWSCWHCCSSPSSCHHPVHGTPSIHVSQRQDLGTLTLHLSGPGTPQEALSSPFARGSSGCTPLLRDHVPLIIWVYIYTYIYICSYICMIICNFKIGIHQLQELYLLDTPWYVKSASSNSLQGSFVRNWMNLIVPLTGIVVMECCDGMPESIQAKSSSMSMSMRPNYYAT